MSGICGIINWDGAPVDPGTLNTMAEAASHRGPDGINYWTEKGVGVAHLALDVLPDERRAAQPLVEGDVVLSGDLRLDNRAELVRTLQQKRLLNKDVPTDAALLMAAYRCWGADCPAYLLGDYAFSLWDSERRRFLAARDPMAMRPLFYRYDQNRLLFGSEIKQLLAVPGVRAELFEPAVGAFLASSFDRLEWTCYDGIMQLSPGHAMRADAGGIKTWRHASLDLSKRIRYTDQREYVEHLRSLLDEAVRSRLMTEKPVGLLLSGGLDSVSIAGTAGHLLSRRSDGPSFRTYSWGFERFTECDERAVSDPIAEHYGFPVKAIEAEKNWPLRDYQFNGPDEDDPYSGVYQPLLSRAFQKAQEDGVRTMMGGGGGDLMMGEYIFDYPGLFWSGKWRKLVSELQLQATWQDVPFYRVAASYLIAVARESLLPPGRLEGPRNVVRSMRKHIGVAPPDRFPEWMRQSFIDRANLRDLLRSSSRRPPLNTYARRQRFAAIHSPLQMQVSTWLERLASSYHCTIADPWTDWRIAQFAVAVPQRVLNTTKEHKRLTRAALQGRVPEVPRQKARKISPAPLYHWALRDKARATVEFLLTDMESAARGFVDEPSLNRQYAAIRRGARPTPGFWRALSMEMWLQNHFSLQQ